MNKLQDLLNIIEFTDVVDFNLDREYKIHADFMLDTYQKHTKESHTYIDYYLYRRRRKDEYWTSLDIKFRKDKVKIILENLDAFIDRNISLKELFDKSENGKVFYNWEIQEKIRVDFINIESDLFLYITKFD